MLILIFRLNRIFCVLSVPWIFPCLEKLPIYWPFLAFPSHVFKGIIPPPASNFPLGRKRPLLNYFPYFGGKEGLSTTQQNSGHFSSGNECRQNSLDQKENWPTKDCFQVPWDFIQFMFLSLKLWPVWSKGANLVMSSISNSSVISVLWDIMISWGKDSLRATFLKEETTNIHADTHTHAQFLIFTLLSR